MGNMGNGRRPHKRITGRFFAFITVAVVLCVLVGVLISRTPKQALPASTSATAPTAAPSGLEADPQVTPAPGVQPEPESEVQPQPIDTSDLSVMQGLPDDWRNILLLGSDSRDTSKVASTDTIMIASINAKSGRIKLVSIMRDTIVPLTDSSGQTQSVKINSLARYGGPKAVIKMVNECFGMNITEYVMVNFAGFQKVIDILGGVRIDITKDEQDEINKSLGEQARVAGLDQAWFVANKKSLELDSYGSQKLLTGIQALGYARIRHVGNSDYQRTNRQRVVLDAVLKKVKDDAGPVKLMQIAYEMRDHIETNVDIMGAVNIASTVIGNGAVKLDASERLPADSTTRLEDRGGVSALWDTDFGANRQLLYTFIYEK